MKSEGAVFNELSRSAALTGHWIRHLKIPSTDMTQGGGNDKLSQKVDGKPFLFYA